MREEKQAQQHKILGVYKDKVLNEVLNKIRHGPQKGHLTEEENS